MSSHTTEAVTSNGAATRQVTAVISDDYLAPASSHSMVAQTTVILGSLTGLWVAVSPWFLVLQHGGDNPTGAHLIVGLAVGPLGPVPLSRRRGLLGLEGGSPLPAVWLVGSP